MPHGWDNFFIVAGTALLQLLIGHSLPSRLTDIEKRKRHSSSMAIPPFPRSKTKLSPPRPVLPAYSDESPVRRYEQVRRREYGRDPARLE
jgi:hypothetical protein